MKASHSSKSDADSQQPHEPPSSILVVGAGVFGLSTILAILESPTYSQTHVTLIDPNLPDTTDRAQNNDIQYRPSSHTASIDSSRIIRPDYANPAYARLAAEAQAAWRVGFGGEDVYHESGLAVVAGREGSQYAEAACQNVENASNDRGEEGPPEDRSKEVERLSSSEEIRVATGLPPSNPSYAEDLQNGEQLGSTGYFNHTSGWANAEGAMRTVMQRILSYNNNNNNNTSRLTLKRANVKQLLLSPSQSSSSTESKSIKPTVTGIVLADSSHLIADLTILATGAWTSSLLDLRGRIKATGQVVAYLPLTASEAYELRKLPVLLNLSTGYFVIPPARNASSPSSSTRTPTPAESSEEYTHHIKLARHAHGYTNPTDTTILSPLPHIPSLHISPSLPSPSSSSSSLPPPSALLGLRTFLRALFPSLHPLSSRPFSSSRLCWYTDTPTGDFLVTYHPEYAGLFLCTGGSGHGFKFLPVLGARVVDVLRGEGGEWDRIWGWREGVREEEEWKGDGSRGGKRGQVLEEVVRRDAAGAEREGKSRL